MCDQPQALHENRISESVEKMRKLFAGYVAEGSLTESKLDEMRAGINLDWEEYVRFQELKSAMMGSVLTTAEALTIYNYLGGTPQHFNSQAFHIKYVMVRVFASLIMAVKNPQQQDRVNGVSILQPTEKGKL